MTIIAYNKGLIAADSRSIQKMGENDVDSFFTAHQTTKLKVEGRGTMAIAVCGPVPSKIEWERISDLFLKKLVIAECIEEIDTAPFTVAEASSIKAHQRFFIAMTKDHTYYMSAGESGETNSLTRVDPDTEIAYGTGARVAYIGMRGGLDTLESVKLAAQVDHNCGGPFLSARQSELKPFIQEEGEFKDLVTDLKVKLQKRRAKAEAKMGEQK